MSFGHAGHDRRGRRGHRDREDRPPRGRRDPGRRADRRDPRRGQGQAGGDGVSEQASHRQAQAGIFIDVEVDDSIADDAELAAKLDEVCPVDIFTADGRPGRDGRREPRRVRPLRALPGRRPRRHDRRQEALRRHRASACAVPIALQAPRFDANWLMRTSSSCSNSQSNAIASSCERWPSRHSCTRPTTTTSPSASPISSATTTRPGDSLLNLASAALTMPTLSLAFPGCNGSHLSKPPGCRGRLERVPAPPVGAQRLSRNLNAQRGATSGRCSAGSYGCPATPSASAPPKPPGCGSRPATREILRGRCRRRTWRSCGN